MCYIFPFLCQWLLSKHATSSVWLCWSQTVWPVAMETNSKQTAGICRFQNIIMRILCCWTVCLPGLRLSADPFTVFAAVWPEGIFKNTFTVFTQIQSLDVSQCFCEFVWTFSVFRCIDMSPEKWATALFIGWRFFSFHVGLVSFLVTVGTYKLDGYKLDGSFVEKVL